MNRSRSDQELARALLEAYPELHDVAAAAGDEVRVYVVGGAVRDLLLDRPRGDLDVAVEGDPRPIAARLGGAELDDFRFLTASAAVDGLRIDLAQTRTETYPHPGALPEVRPATLAEDLARRDFSVNAMAVEVPPEAAGGESRKPETALIDPHGGREDLFAGVLRLLHPGSIRDDPTRALRGARYAAAYGLEPDPATREQLAGADLDAVSAERRLADLRRIAAAPQAVEALELLGDWGVLELRPAGPPLGRRVAELLSSPPWEGAASREEAILEAVLGPPAGEVELASAQPASPSEACEIAARHRPVELALARAMGAEWLDEYMGRWRRVRLDIDGGDLIAAGVEQGPAIGRGLGEALRRKLDGEISGREEELGAALAAAGEDADAVG